MRNASFRAAVFAIAAIVMSAAASPASAAVTMYDWTGAGTTNQWTTTSYWASGAIAPTNGSYTTACFNVDSASAVLHYTAAQGTTRYTNFNSAAPSYGYTLIAGNTSNGTLSIDGGVLESRSMNWDVVGNGGHTGVLIINGGSYNNVAEGSAHGELRVGSHDNGSVGKLYIEQGNCTVTTLTVGNNTATGYAYLDGGILSVGSITTDVLDGSGPGYFYFNGGTLTALNDSANFMKVQTAYVENNGAVINTSGHSVTISQALTQYTGSTGGLTKLGAGTLTLSAANTYTGATTVSAGMLNVTGTIGNGGIYVASAGNSSGSFDGTQATYRQAFAGAYNLKTAINSDLLTSGTVAASSAATVAMSWRNRAATDVTLVTQTKTFVGPETNLLLSDIVNVTGTSGDYTLTMSYDPTHADLSTLAIAWYDTTHSQWETIGGTPGAGNTISVTTSNVGQFAVVPEPGTLALLAGALLSLLAYAWRKRK